MSVCFFVSADEEFDELCFEFGLELDEIVSEFSQMTLSIYFDMS